VQSRRSHGLPLKCHVERVVGEDDFLVVVALIQADALAAP
jgi:hypothetical protein